MTLRRQAALVIASVMAVTIVAAPAGAQYGEGTDFECARLVDEAGRELPGIPTLAQGQNFRVIGNISDADRRCADPGAMVDFVLTTNPTVTLQGNVLADSEGNYESTMLTVPRSWPTGPSSVEVHTTLNGEEVVWSRTVRIVAVTAPTAPRLPVSGWDIAALTIWGIVVLGLGVFLAAASRRRLRAAGREDTGMKLPARPARRSPVAVFGEGSSAPEPAYYGDSVRTEPSATPAPSTAEPARELVGVGAAVTDRWLADDLADVQTEREEPANAAATSKISAAVGEAGEQTSELVSRLQQEIRGWTEPKA